MEFLAIYWPEMFISPESGEFESKCWFFGGCLKYLEVCSLFESDEFVQYLFNMINLFNICSLCLEVCNYVKKYLMMQTFAIISIFRMVDRWNTDNDRTNIFI